MAIPQSYSSFVTYDLDDFQPHFIAKLQSEDRIHIRDKTLCFENEIFFVKFTTSFSIIITKDIITVSYEIDAVPLIKIISAFLVFAGLFSSFTASAFFYYGALASICIYIFGLFFIHSQFFRIIKKYQKNIEESLTDEQAKWMKDPNRCSACGEELLKYQSKCHSCGLQSRAPINFSPFSTTHQSQKLKYTYKEK